MPVVHLADAQILCMRLPLGPVYRQDVIGKPIAMTAGLVTELISQSNFYVELEK